MSFPREELLQPTLSHSTIAKAPYSIQTTFITAFLGGPFAAIAIAALNSIRLKRWVRDIAPLSIALIAYIGFLLIFTFTEWGISHRNSLNEVFGERALALMHRLMAFLFFALGYVLHRKEQRSADAMGLDRPSGWIAGLACIAANIILLIALENLSAARTGA